MIDDADLVVNDVPRDYRMLLIVLLASEMINDNDSIGDDNEQT